MKGRLNIFQGAMLRWRELHPYNAVHVVRVDARLDATRLSRDIDAVLTTRGLTGLVLDAARARYEYGGGAPQTSSRCLPAATIRTRLCAARSSVASTPTCLHRPDGSVPVFAVDAGPRCHIGVAYDHVVAGGDSIVELLAAIVCRYTGENAAVASQPVPSLYPGTCRPMLIRHWGYVLAGMTAVPGALASARRSLRPRYAYGDSRQNAFATMRIAKPGVAALSRAARAWDVTRADLMIALLMKAIAPIAGDARHGKRRREIGIAWIVNIRRDFGTSFRESFGQFLSSYRCAHPVPSGISVHELAQDVHRVTSRSGGASSTS
jgi:hypothetical protein